MIVLEKRRESSILYAFCLLTKDKLKMNQIFQHSCETMPELKDGSVALTVTSPPYWNAIDYDVHALDKSQYYRTRSYGNGYLDYSDYLEWLGVIFREVLRVTKPGGFCGIVIGTVLLNGRHYPVPFDTVVQLVNLGWEFHQDIVWHKCTAGVKRAGVTIQKPYPGYYYPNIMTEYILVFRKPGPPIHKGRSEEDKEKAKIPINKLFTMDIANNIWHIAPVPPDYIDHPAPFPEEIPYRLITMYSYPNEIVLDPFLGSGTTCKVAKHLNRQYVGYEVIPKYVELSKKRLNEPLNLRQEQLIVIFDKIGLDEPSASTNTIPHKRRRKSDAHPLPLFDPQDT
jgi:site-specific DNA-methyltransferase (adenine-specific)